MADYTQEIADAAAQNGVDPNLAIAVANQESGQNENAVSSAGAIGVMQLMPGTAAMYGADPYDAADNIQAGTSYLGDLLNQFGGDQAAALAAYNWGPGNVQKAQALYGANWLQHAPAETQNYVAKILGGTVTQYAAATPALAPAPAAGSIVPPSGTATLFPSLPAALPAANPQLAADDWWIPVAIVGGLMVLVLRQ